MKRSGQNEVGNEIISTINYTADSSLIDPGTESYLRGKAYRRLQTSAVTSYSRRVDSVDSRKWNGLYVRETVSHRTYVHACYRLNKPGSRLYLSRDVFVIDAVTRLQTSHVAPRGWKWNLDLHGVRIVSRKNPDMDYHPSPNEWNRLQSGALSPGAFTLVAETNYRIREKEREQDRRREKDERELRALIDAGLVGVTVLDSQLAGNCPAGTISFVRSQGIDVNCCVVTRVVDARIALRAGERGLRAAMVAARRVSEVCI